MTDLILCCFVHRVGDVQRIDPGFKETDTLRYADWTTLLGILNGIFFVPSSFGVRFAFANALYVYKSNLKTKYYKDSVIAVEIAAITLNF